MAARAAAARVAEFCAARPEGVTTDDMVAALGLSHAELVTAINELLASHKLGAHRHADGRELFKAKKPEEGQKFKGLSAEEVLVYQAVEAAGNVGVWTKDLRARTNLQQPAVARMLKALEGRGLVQAVRSVASGSRKVYMLAGVEPAREVTGGAWYTGNEFDAPFTAALRAAAAAFVRRAGRGGVTVGGAAAQLAATGLARVALRDDDVRTVLDALVADGLAERRGGGGDDSDGDDAPIVYVEAPDAARARARGGWGGAGADGGAEPPPPPPPLAGLPCGVCPVAAECADGGAVSPATCVYFEAWLNEF